MTSERRVAVRDAAGQWQEFRAGAVSVLAAGDFGVPVPPLGDLVQVCFLAVTDTGVLDDVFALRDREDPAEFEQALDVSARWTGMEYDGQQWARIDIEVRRPVSAMARLVMHVAAVRPALELAAGGRAVFIVRESSLHGAQSSTAVVNSAIPVFQGNSGALDSLLRG